MGHTHHHRKRRIEAWCSPHGLRAYVHGRMKRHASEQRRRQDRQVDDMARTGVDFDAIVLRPDARLTDPWRFD